MKEQEGHRGGSFDDFTNCLAVLANADFKMAETDDIYRTGIIGQFNLTFELAWKALQEVMRMHSVAEVANGSPREILQLAYINSDLSMILKYGCSC